MPFKSDKQRKYLYANEPEVAKEFAMKSPKKSSMGPSMMGQSMDHSMHPYMDNPYTKVTQPNKNSAYSKAIREGNQSPAGSKKTSATGAVGGSGG